MKRSSLLLGLVAALCIAAAALAVVSYRNVLVRLFWHARPPRESAVRQGILVQDAGNGDIETIATRLGVPWAIAFLPDGSMLVTERAGVLRRLGADGTSSSIAVEGVQQDDEAGLLGVAVHPDFSENGWIYLYASYLDPRGALKNRIDRYRFGADGLAARTTILQGIPAAGHRNGGALAFGPDGKLYATTGDASDETTAQDLQSLGGKILRFNDDGSVPADNPFGTAVWSYGHRNPQGLAWDREGRLWAPEHGRSGLTSGHDEINLILPGKNYGWPDIQGAERREGMESPAVQSGADETWAPSGAAYLNGRIFFGGLRGEALYQASVDADPVVITSHFESEYGRIRAVAVGPDGLLYFTTSNTDGRGVPKDGDDRLIRVQPRLFR